LLQVVCQRGTILRLGNYASIGVGGWLGVLSIQVGFFLKKKKTNRKPYNSASLKIFWLKKQTKKITQGIKFLKVNIFSSFKNLQIYGR